MKMYFGVTSKALAMCLSIGAIALPLRAETVLAKGGAIAILTADVEADVMQRVPEEARNDVLARSTTVIQIAGNLYARRAMAGFADAASMRDDPEVLAALNVARDRVLSDAWLAKIVARATPSREVIERLALDRYRADPKRFTTPETRHLRHILILGNEAKDRAKAEKVLEELRAGESFERLAKEYSADKQSGEKGGDLGFVKSGQMVPEFESAGFALKKANDFSGVVETKFGYHVIQLVEIKPSSLSSFDDVRESLEKEVVAKIQQDARTAEAQRLLSAMVPDQAAVAAFVAKQKPIELK